MKLPIWELFCFNGNQLTPVRGVLEMTGWRVFTG